MIKLSNKGSLKTVTQNIKPRPHRRCPCGSRKKYRNCCGVDKSTRFQDLPKDTQEMFQKLRIKWQLENQYHTQHFGHVAGIASCIFQGRRIVGVGSTFVACDDPKQDWKTPSDFLISHLKTTIGNEWFDNEVSKPKTDRHIIMKWYTDGHIDSNKPNPPNQYTEAFFHLAYDLFVLHNHSYLTKNLIRRLKVASSFNGARYELFVLATMVRAGFTLEPFDETLGLGQVTECRATYADTGENLQVEAKTRNVKGVLGALEGNRKNINLHNKLRDAVEKDVAEPYIVFVDINLPELNIYKNKDKIDKIINEYKKLETSHPNHLPNLICFTNIPFHYGNKDNQPIKYTIFTINSEKPRVKLKNDKVISDAITVALDNYQYLPKEFNESVLHADNILKNI